MSTNLHKYFTQHQNCINAMADDIVLNENLIKVISMITQAFQNQNKVLFCGNGGSAADAEHLAGELSGKFKIDRKPLFAEALHVNAAALTAIANDYDYIEVYARLLESKAIESDILIAISTSGQSTNILKAIEKAKTLGVFVVGMGGKTGHAMQESSDIYLSVPSTDTPRIQEAYMLLGHIICEEVEKNLFAT